MADGVAQLTQVWRLDDGRQSLVLAGKRNRLPEVVYWGAPLPQAQDIGILKAAAEIDVTGGMLDENPDLSICPEATRTFPGQPGLILRDQDGTPLLPKFCFAAEETTDNGLVLTYEDTAALLTYRAHFEAVPDTRMLTLWAELVADLPIHLHWLSAPVLP
ncbi:MAG: alpha-galactosidase, partial [Pseudomonadota bacterium]